MFMATIKVMLSPQFWSSRWSQIFSPPPHLFNYFNFDLHHTFGLLKWSSSHKNLYRWKLRWLHWNFRNNLGSIDTQKFHWRLTKARFLEVLSVDWSLSPLYDNHWESEVPVGTFTLSQVISSTMTWGCTTLHGGQIWGSLLFPCGWLLGTWYFFTNRSIK